LWKPGEESPTEAMLRDPLFLANIVGWAVGVVLIIYWAALSA
jgi:hypothetical protein